MTNINFNSSGLLLDMSITRILGFQCTTLMAFLIILAEILYKVKVLNMAY